MAVWQPAATRTIPATMPVSFKIRGLAQYIDLTLPDATLGAPEDYSVDFSQIIPDGRRIVQVAINAPGASIGWVSIYGASTVTFWASWPSAGSQAVQITALLDDGTTQTVTTSINVLSTGVLIVTAAQTVAPNAFYLTASVFVPDASGQPLILG